VLHESYRHENINEIHGHYFSHELVELMENQVMEILAKKKEE
jgi:hypothetical protein